MGVVLSSEIPVGLYLATRNRIPGNVTCSDRCEVPRITLCLLKVQGHGFKRQDSALSRVAVRVPLEVCERGSKTWRSKVSFQTMMYFWN